MRRIIVLSAIAAISLGAGAAGQAGQGPATPPQPQPRLMAALPAVQGDGSVNPAELLTLDPTLLSIGAMS